MITSADSKNADSNSSNYPQSIEDDLSCPDAETWKEAMEAEMNSHHENGTWSLCSNSPSKMPIMNEVLRELHTLLTVTGTDTGSILGNELVRDLTNSLDNALNKGTEKTKTESHRLTNLEGDPIGVNQSFRERHTLSKRENQLNGNVVELRKCSLVVSVKSVKQKISTPVHGLRRNMSDENFENMIDFLSNETWGDIYNSSEVEMQFNTFHDTIIRHFNATCTLNPVKITKHNSKEWVNNDIRSSSYELKKLYYIQKSD
ncbi:hypothetical protein JTB14_016574 [Gonioctena quinquepunctata]|nr:hypothetical protein JTB14_016574 [Gonioctena quinquepunctata]